MVVFNFGDGLISHAPRNSPIAFGDANNARIEVAPDPCPSNLTCNETSNVTLISKVWFCGFNGWVLGISFKYIGPFWNLNRKPIPKHVWGSATKMFTILTISDYFSIASAMVVFNFGDGLISHAPRNSPIAFGDANNARIEVAPDPCPSNLTCNETSNVTLISKVWFCGFNGWVLGISFKYIGPFWNLNRKPIPKHVWGSATQNVHNFNYFRLFFKLMTNS